MWLSGPPFSRPSTRCLALRVRGARRAMCLALHPSRAQQCLCNIAHRKVYYVHTTGGTMRKVPHILYIIYKNGQNVRLNLGAQTPAQRQAKLNYWSKTAGAKTAFLAWK
jgi:hypothetical protein